MQESRIPELLRETIRFRFGAYLTEILGSKEEKVKNFSKSKKDFDPKIVLICTPSNFIASTLT